MWEKINVMYGGLKMLETIITAVTFAEFSIWVFFHEQSRFTIERAAEEVEPLGTSSTALDTQILACRLPQRAHLYL